MINLFSFRASRSRALKDRPRCTGGDAAARHLFSFAPIQIFFSLLHSITGAKLQALVQASEHF